MRQDDLKNKENKENINSMNYNPNRPNQNETNESTKKAVDTAAETVANRYAPGVYRIAKKVPGVGKAIDTATSKAADTVSKVPGVDTVSNIADKSGVLDVLGESSEPKGSKQPSKESLVVKNNHNKAKQEQTKNNYSSQNKFRRNNSLNSLIMGGYESQTVEEENLESNLDNGENDLENNTVAPSTLNSPNVNTGEKQDTINKASELAKNAISSKVLKKAISSKVLIITGAICFFVILLFLIIGGGGLDSDNSAYVDTMCNYNETQVTVTNCYTSSSDRLEYETVNIKDYIIGATYAYTHGNSYSDETIKALMITLKTNTLSLGGYNSSSKSVNIKSCSTGINYCNINNGCNIKEENGVKIYEQIEGEYVPEIPAISNDYKTKLESIYNEVSNYLYISSSYNSTIKRLSTRNALEFDENTLAKFEELATSGNNYQSILNTMYNVEEELEEKEESSNTPKEEATKDNTIFVGDSRVSGLNSLVDELDDTNTVYAGGRGYYWFVGTAHPSSNYNAYEGGIIGVNKILNNNKSTSYNIVLWLGINDLNYLGGEGNITAAARKYVDKYSELASGEWSNHTLYMLPVGPVDDNKMAAQGNNYRFHRNSYINEFNNELKTYSESLGLTNLLYLDIDMHSLNLDVTSDGLHYYNKQDNINIYNTAMDTINNSESISSKLKLYNLDTYCHQYTITENDYYWWPIGSTEETGDNIYAGVSSYTRISSPFGWRNCPFHGREYHSGIDIPAPAGTPLIASSAGKVITATYHSSLGNYVELEHDDGNITRYAHSRKLLVKVGDTVQQGEIIAETGTTGNSTGNHLHFEIRIAGKPVNPLDYVDPENQRPVSVSSINVVGGEGKSAVCQTLLASGYSKNATAAIMTNIQGEGTFQTNNLEDCYEIGQCCKGYYGYCKYGNIIGKYGSDEAYTAAVDSGAYPKSSFMNDHAGYGMIQWTFHSRKGELYDYAKKQNKSIADIGVQLGFLMEEVKGYADTYKYLTGNYDATSMTLQFCREFENPGGSCSTRVNNHLQSMLNYVNNGCQE